MSSLCLFVSCVIFQLKKRRSWAELLIIFLIWIVRRRHHSQVRYSPWTMFFNGVTCHQNRIGRSLPVGNVAQPVSIPQGEHSAAQSFLEGALTKAGLLSAKR